MAVRIPVSAPLLAGREREYVLGCIDDGWISSLGGYVERFEHAFAAFCGCPHGVATSNGTSALHLALAALGVGPGDEVLVPDLTFVATANAVRHAGATPVLVDVSGETWGMDPADAARKVTPKTAAMIVVHLYGQPADMTALLDVAGRHGLLVIEDAAQAHGATFHGRRVGSIGHAGTFSFYGNKIITTGEGGMLVTRDAAVAARARSLRGHAMDPARVYFHTEVGFNYRMTNIQAAIGCAQLEQIEDILARKQAIADAYRTRLERVPGLGLSPRVPATQSVFWMYSIVLDDGFGFDRDATAAALAVHGIETRPFFVPLHQLPAFRSPDAFPVATRLGERGLNLPSGAGLSLEQVEEVCARLLDCAGQPMGDDDAAAANTLR